MEPLKPTKLFPVVTSALQHASPTTGSLPSSPTYPLRSLNSFVQEAKGEFLGRMSTTDDLLKLSVQLQEQCKESLQTSETCMLPSYNHTLPTGEEQGDYLALDVGGSNLRVAVVKLYGRKKKAEIYKMFNYTIREEERMLEGRAFFDWMAGRIEDCLGRVGEDGEKQKEYLAGVAWSFPVEQTSERSGAIIEMGKGFKASKGIVGEDLAEIIVEACKERNMNVKVEAIINDGCATLLSQAYNDTSTRLGLIVGTGTNMAMMIPVVALGDSKYANRSAEWTKQAKNVLVNTEYSMFGKGILPFTRWDETLNSVHLHPDYQPFEYMIGGRYLGEIVRLVLAEGVQTAHLFGGELTPQALEAYTLDTRILALIEADTTSDLKISSALIQDHFKLKEPPSPFDLHAIREIIQAVSNRASELLASAIHALWSVRASAIGVKPEQIGRVAIGCNGSVIERYPGFLQRTQKVIDELLGEGRVELEIAVESAIFGAAVAVACLQ